MNRRKNLEQRHDNYVADIKRGVAEEVATISDKLDTIAEGIYEVRSDVLDLQAKFRILEGRVSQLETDHDCGDQE